MRARADDVAVEFDDGAVTYAEARWGDMHVAQYRLAPGADLTPYFAELPGGQCSGNHWGIVLEGSIHVRYADGTEETTVAGELYHWPAGHVGWSDEGVVFVAVTPLAEELEMEAHMASAGAGG